MIKMSRSKSKGVFARAEMRKANKTTSTAKIIVLTVTGFLVGSIWLATITKVPELVRAQGMLIPTGHFQQVQAPESGIVVDVFARDGERVEQGQTLATLSSIALEQSLQEVKIERAAILLKLENLAAILKHAGVQSDAFAMLEAIDDDNLAYAVARLELFAEEQAAQNSLRHHLETTLLRLERARELTVSRIKERAKRVERAKNLVEENLAPRRILDIAQDGMDQLQANLIELEIRLSQAHKELGKVTVDLDSNLISLKDKTTSEQFEFQERIKILDEQIAILEARRSSLEIRAPETGIIHAVGYPNGGEVIAAGATLFELMPEGPHLVAELEIDPVDIGHIRRGDAVTLKFDTFDARRYGQIAGQITSISPNSVVDETTGNSYFRATVTLDSTTIGQGDWERPLFAGMGTSAEVVTDERSVMAYLIKPINRSLTDAFGER